MKANFDTICPACGGLKGGANPRARTACEEKVKALNPGKSEAYKACGDREARKKYKTAKAWVPE